MSRLTNPTAVPRAHLALRHPTRTSSLHPSRLVKNLPLTRTALRLKSLLDYDGLTLSPLHLNTQRERPPPEQHAPQAKLQQHRRSPLVPQFKKNVETRRGVAPRKIVTLARGMLAPRYAVMRDPAARARSALAPTTEKPLPQAPADVAVADLLREGELQVLAQMALNELGVSELADLMPTLTAADTIAGDERKGTVASSDQGRMPPGDHMNTKKTLGDGSKVKYNTADCTETSAPASTTPASTTPASSIPAGGNFFKFRKVHHPSARRRPVTAKAGDLMLKMAVAKAEKSRMELEQKKKRMEKRRMLLMQFKEVRQKIRAEIEQRKMQKGHVEKLEEAKKRKGESLEKRAGPRGEMKRFKFNA